MTAATPYSENYADQSGNRSASQRSGMAIAALVLGILALVTCWTVIGGVVLGVLGVVFGVIASRRASRGEASGRGMAITGIVTGAIGLVLAVALIAFGVSILNRTSTKNLEHCLSNAHGNQTAVQQCDDQYRNSVGSGS